MNEAFEQMVIAEAEKHGSKVIAHHDGKVWVESNGKVYVYGWTIDRE